MKTTASRSAPQGPEGSSPASISIIDFRWNVGAWKAVGYHFRHTPGVFLSEQSDQARISVKFEEAMKSRYSPLPGKSEAVSDFRQGFVLSRETNIEQYVKSAYPPNGISTPELSILGENQKIPGVSLHTSKNGSMYQLVLRDEFTKEKRVIHRISCKESDLFKALNEIFGVIEAHENKFGSRNDRFLDSIPKAKPDSYSIGIKGATNTVPSVERALLQNIAKNSLMDIGISLKPRGPADVPTEENGFYVNRDFMAQSPLRGIECNGEVTAIFFTAPKTSVKLTKVPTATLPVRMPDKFGNEFVIGLDPDHASHYVVMINPKPSATRAGEYAYLPIDFTPIGRSGESTKFVYHRPPTSISSGSGLTISSSLGEADLKDFTIPKQMAVAQSVAKVEKLFGYQSGQLANQVRIEKAHEAAVYASSWFPKTIFIDDNTLIATPTSLALTGIHESAHLVDLATGWKISNALRPIHERIKKNFKEFFDSIDKETFVLNGQMKGHEGFDHSADSPEELFASLLVSITALDDATWKKQCKEYGDLDFYQTYRECLETIRTAISTQPSPFPPGVKPTGIIQNLNTKILHLLQLEKGKA